MVTGLPPVIHSQIKHSHSLALKGPLSVLTRYKVLSPFSKIKENKQRYTGLLNNRVNGLIRVPSTINSWSKNHKTTLAMYVLSHDTTNTTPIFCKWGYNNDLIYVYSWLYFMMMTDPFSKTHTMMIKRHYIILIRK